jgi:hypothetical protein
MKQRGQGHGRGINSGNGMSLGASYGEIMAVDERGFPKMTLKLCNTKIVS